MNGVKHLKRGGALGLVLLLAVSAPGQEEDKSGYTLWHPTPRHLMRELSTDRPDQTESAYSVDAGHFQVEADLVNHAREKDGGVTTRIWAAPVLNLKLGLLNNVDVQCLFDPYVRFHQESAAGQTTIEGFGDLQTRVKVNLWGNDGGRTALAVMPFVKWPVPESPLRNGKTEGGVIVPFAMELPAGWGLGLMTELDVVRDSANQDYELESFNTATLSHDIWGRLGGYIEFAATVNTEAGTEWIGQVDCGFTFAVNDDLQLDAGCNFGVTDSAPDYQPFVGVSWRY